MLDRCRRHRSTLTVVASIGASLALVFVLISKWGELETGVTGAPLAIAAAAVSLQVVALVSRSEAWFGCVRAGGGTVSRRTLYRASSMGFVGGLVHTQLGTAARIGALRRLAPEESPRVPTLVGAELPILIVEGGLAALTSFTLVGPLGLPWWVPLVCLGAIAAASAALGAVAAAGVRWLRGGLAVMRTLDGRARLVCFVLIAVFSQIARNWLMLHAVGVDASVFDAVAVLIAVVTLGQLPFGLSVGAAASVLILGPQGVAAAAAAGVLLTATGTVGALGVRRLGRSRHRTIRLTRKGSRTTRRHSRRGSGRASIAGNRRRSARGTAQFRCRALLLRRLRPPPSQTAARERLRPRGPAARPFSRWTRRAVPAGMGHFSRGSQAAPPRARLADRKLCDESTAGRRAATYRPACFGGHTVLKNEVAMPTTKLLLATGDELDVEGSLEEVAKALENAARSSAGTLARLTQAETGEPVAVNARQIVAVRPGSP